MSKKRNKSIIVKEPKKRNFLVPHLMTRSGGGRHRNRKRDSKNSHKE